MRLRCASVTVAKGWWLILRVSAEGKEPLIAKDAKKGAKFAKKTSRSNGN